MIFRSSATKLKRKTNFHQALGHAASCRHGRGPGARGQGPWANGAAAQPGSPHHHAIYAENPLDFFIFSPEVPALFSKQKQRAHRPVKFPAEPATIAEEGAHGSTQGTRRTRDATQPTPGQGAAAWPRPRAGTRRHERRPRPWRQPATPTGQAKGRKKGAEAYQASRHEQGTHESTNEEKSRTILRDRERNGAGSRVIYETARPALAHRSERGASSSPVPTAPAQEAQAQRHRTGDGRRRAPVSVYERSLSLCAGNPGAMKTSATAWAARSRGMLDGPAGAAT